jgi:hypothetical protein
MTLQRRFAKALVDQLREDFGLTINDPLRTKEGHYIIVNYGEDEFGLLTQKKKHARKRVVCSFPWADPDGIGKFHATVRQLTGRAA